jgi:hypothetical protein
MFKNYKGENISMKVKLYNLINTKDSYLKLSDQGYLPILIRFSLSEDLEKVTDTINRFEKLKNDLIIRYGTTDSNGIISISPTDKGYDDFVKEVNELAGKDIDLETEKISEELFKVDACTLTAKDFVILRNIFTEPKKKVEEKQIETQ